MEKITNKKKIISFLAEHKCYFCDDCIREFTKLSQRQTVNKICNSNVDIFVTNKNLKCHNCGKIKITRSLKNLEQNFEEKIMNQREQITKLIEDYIEKYAKGEEVILNEKDIRDWPAVVKLCNKKNPANICNAMDAVKFQHEKIEGDPSSTSYTLKYIKSNS